MTDFCACNAPKRFSAWGTYHLSKTYLLSQTNTIGTGVVCVVLQLSGATDGRVGCMHAEREMVVVVGDEAANGLGKFLSVSVLSKSACTNRKAC